jgi:hypothetical protein
MRFEKKTIFVTRAAGFRGSAAARHLLDDTSAFMADIAKLAWRQTVPDRGCRTGRVGKPDAMAHFAGQ